MAGDETLAARLNKCRGREPSAKPIDLHTAHNTTTGTTAHTTTARGSAAHRQAEKTPSSRLHNAGEQAGIEWGWQPRWSHHHHSRMFNSDTSPIAKQPLTRSRASTSTNKGSSLRLGRLSHTTTPSHLRPPHFGVGWSLHWDGKNGAGY